MEMISIVSGKHVETVPQQKYLLRNNTSSPVQGKRTSALVAVTSCARHQCLELQLQT